jgi:RNA polymerase sigma factor (sigma-70 family)
MANAHMGAVLRHIRGLAASPPEGRRSDGALLRAFAAENDQAAFTALVKRHGPLVLAVCRRVLHNHHDAEDAFQATFILLARSAGSVRKQESLASWLHGVAYRMAKNAKRAVLRRRKHEGGVRPMRERAPAEDMAWGEVQGLLDEEIQRLPEVYRVAFILCCLENKTGPEAARALGIKEGTVRTRLTKARALLQKALARRGVALWAVLAAVGLPAALPGPLVASTVRATTLLAAGNAVEAGVISASVAQLLRGAKTTMFPTRLTTITALVVTLAVTGAGIGLSTGRDEPAPPPAAGKPAGEGPPAASAPKAASPDRTEDKTPVEVSGQVLDPKGKPVKGATLYLGYATPRGFGLPRRDPNPGGGNGGLLHEGKEPSGTVRARSGEDGKFRFTFAKSELDDTLLEEAEAEPAVIAVAPGSGPDWAAVKGKTADLTLRLVRDDVPINGRILDVDGRPVGGVKVRVVCVAIESEKWEKKWAGPVPGQPASVTTGADGRFRLTGLGRDRWVILALEGASIQHRQISARTVPAGAAGKAGGDGHRLPAMFDYVAPASRPIRGVVRDKATGKPVAGVRMSSRETQAVAYTDKEGRYELLGCPKSRWYTVTARPQNGQLYFAAWKGAADTPGLDALAMDFDLVGGIELRGRVTDRVTGKPPRRAVVEYYPLYPNANVRKIPDYPDTAASSAVTGPDGSYRLVALPGPGVVGVIAGPPDSYAHGLVTPKELAGLFKDGKDHGNEVRLYIAHGEGYGAILQERYSSLTLITPAEGAAPLTRDIALAPARTLRGTVLGPDGKPLAGATVMGLTWTVETHSPEILEGGDFVVRRLTPGRTRDLVFQHKGQGLGKFVVVPGDRTEPLVVRLEPYGSATGRLLGRDNQPMPGNKLQMGRTGFVGPELPDKTDREGRFRVGGLIPGQKYWLQSSREGLGWHVEFTAESGPKNLGDLHPRGDE